MAGWLGLPAVENYKNLNLRKLPFNHAYVFTNTTLENIGVYSVKDECFLCPYKLEQRLRPGEEISWKVDTSSQSTWRIMNTAHRDTLNNNDKNGLLCEMRPVLGEYGVYEMDIGRCEMETKVDPIYSFMSLFLCIFFLAGLGISYLAAKYVFKKNVNKEKSGEGVYMKIKDANCDMTGLYMFRGLIITLIIFLTSGGGGYPLFTKEFGGVSLVDCLFFAFAWTIGVNIPTSIDNCFAKGQRKCCVIGMVLLRSVGLIFLGIVIESTVKKSDGELSIWWPLQRLGVAYLVVASSYVLTVQKFEIKSKKICCKAVAVLVSLLWCWVISGFILTIIVILISTMGSFNCQGNISLLANNPEILAETTLGCKSSWEVANLILVAMETPLYVTKYFAFSKGFMGIISTVMCSMIGLKAGTIYLHHECHSDRVKLWSIWALLFGIGGLIFAGVSRPFDFNLWPIASLLFITTIALLLYSLHYILSEKWRVTCSSNMALGITSLVILAGQQLFAKSLPFSWQIDFNNHLCMLGQNFWTVFLWAAIARCLHKKNVVFSI